MERKSKNNDLFVLPRSSRAFLVGSTETGKSTLGEILMNAYRKEYSEEDLPVRTLIIDTKPRFKAEYELNGVPTFLSGRYKKWGYGSGIIPDSYVLPKKVPILHELNQVWRLGGNIAIVQSESQSEWPEVIKYAESFYEEYGAKYPRLLFVDELADFFEMRSLGDIFRRVARNGRERDVSLIAGSQRPRRIPVEIMTEMKRIYMFELNFMEDIKHVFQFGIPRDLMQPIGHQFYMFDRHLKNEEPSHKYYELIL